MSERTKAGIARKVAQDMRMGPPAKSQDQIEQVQWLKGEGMSNYAIRKAIGIAASTVAKYVG